MQAVGGIFRNSLDSCKFGRFGGTCWASCAASRATASAVHIAKLRSVFSLVVERRGWSREVHYNICASKSACFRHHVVDWEPRRTITASTSTRSPNSPCTSVRLTCPPLVVCAFANGLGCPWVTKDAGCLGNGGCIPSFPARARASVFQKKKVEETMKQSTKFLVTERATRNNLSRNCHY